METVGKPICKLSDQNGNIFNLVGIASLTLKKAGMKDQAKELTEKIPTCQSYDEALQLIMKYVDVV